MKRRGFRIAVLAALVLVMFLFGAALAETQTVASGSCGRRLKWTLDSEGTLNITGSGVMTSWTEGKAPWYAHRNAIFQVNFANGATSIGDYAFYGLKAATRVSLSEDISSIGARAFGDCSAMEEINLFETVVERVGEGAFYNCSSLNEIALPWTMTEIGKSAFYNCSALKNAQLSDTLTTIGDSAFYNCSALPVVLIPDSVVSIGTSAFAECGSLITAKLPASLTQIGASAFSGCDSMTSITIPEGVVGVGDSAFKGCSSLLRAVFPRSLESVASNAFAGCGSFTAMVFENTGAYRWCTGNGIAHKLLVGRGVCGDTGSYVTWQMDTENTLSVSGYGRMRDFVYSAGMNYPWASYTETIERAVIDHGVTEVGKYAFWSVHQLAEVKLPRGLTRLGPAAFSGCGKLTQIDLPDTLQDIGDSAFMDCAGLTGTIVIPEGVKTISGYLFKNCTNLKRVVLPDGVKSIDSYAFENCKNLTTLNLPDGLEYLGAAVFMECNRLSGTIAIPEGMVSVPDYLFLGCSSLEGVIIPEGVTIIGYASLQQCSSIRSITIPQSVKTIKDQAFCRCNGLKDVIIPENVESIGMDAFSGCYNVEKIVFLGEKMPALGDRALSSIGEYIPVSCYCYEFSGPDFWASGKGNYTVIYLDGMDLTSAWSLDLPERVELPLNGSMKAKLQYFPRLPSVKISWSSSDPEIVSVENGLLSGVGTGRATITVSSGSLRDSMEVLVYVEPTAFDISRPEVWIVSKQALQLSVVNLQPEFSASEFKWESSDTEIFTVADGLISAKMPGDAVLTVTSRNGVSRSCNVHVCYPVTAIAFDPAYALASAGEKVQLNAVVTARTRDVINQLVEFTSENEGIARVDAQGNVTGIAPGMTRISATAASGVKTSCTVVVVEDSIYTLPANTTRIEAEAFAGNCAEAVLLPSGVSEIGARAFAENAKLRMIYMPDSVESIAADAFADSKNVVFICESGNTAAEIAAELGIEYLVP